jgi:hypothetical protein
MSNQKNATQAENYIKAPTKKQKFINGFAMLGCASVITAIGLGTATFNQRIDTAKEKMVYGYELSENEAEKENAKIRSSMQAVTYYCNTHSDNPKCSNFNNMNNPLGMVQKVSYTPNSRPLIAIQKPNKRMPNNPFSFQANKAPPKFNKNHDKIGQIVAENNLKNVINAKY